MEEKDIILAKWLSGDLSDEEVQAAAGDINLEYLRSVLEAQDKLEITSSDASTQWDRLQAKMDSTPTVESAPKRSNWMTIGVIMLVIALLTSYFLWNKDTVVRSPSNDFLLYAFEDGSTARIWPGSSISYDIDGYDQNRQITLNGQAFFEVQKGSPFVVETTSGEVKVLGTSFDVWSIDRENMEVRCVSGRVQVSDNKANSAILTAGDRVMIEENNLGAIEVLDLANVETDSLLKYYDNALISWVITDLEKIYDTRIDIDSKLMKERFTGVVSTKDLNRSLTYLCETMQWNYEQKGQSINITVKE